MRVWGKSPTLPSHLPTGSLHCTVSVHIVHTANELGGGVGGSEILNQIAELLDWLFGSLSTWPSRAPQPFMLNFTVVHIDECMIVKCLMRSYYLLRRSRQLYLNLRYSESCNDTAWSQQWSSPCIVDQSKWLCSCLDSCCRFQSEHIIAFRHVNIGLDCVHKS